MQFQDQTILVTGASRGIGRAIAHAFAAEGGRIAIHYRHNREAAEATRTALPDGPHRLFAADVARPDQCARLVNDVVAQMGALHVLVNNAGIFQEHSLPDVDYATWQAAWTEILQVNLSGPANLMYCAAQQMIKQGGGRIVNISSRGAFRGEPEAPAYGASKAGLNAMSQSLAKKLAPHGIFVGVVAPGFVETDMADKHLSGPQGDAIRNQSPLGRVARPEEVARAARFLAAPGTEFMTGAIIDVNGASYLRT
jgi:NAD(P)-dependent dehydrogenase (short-subunit alcohol dehydrogenase family)